MHELLKGRSWEDHPHMIARIFKMKLKLYLRIIIEKHWFATVAAHVCAVVLQTQGIASCS